MPLIRSVAFAAALVLSSLLAHAQEAPAVHAWQGPASAAAAAAKANAALPATAPAGTAAPVAPAPVPAQRPESAAPSPAAPETTGATGAAPAETAAVSPPAPAASAPAPAPATGAAPPAPKADAAPGKGAKGKKAQPARELFGAAKTPAPLAARAIGWYAKGCLSGAKALPVDGPAWQVMRLSRNRMWGHPELVELVERLATESKEKDAWPGLLVGDLAQPRGGPMTSGHASHQVGLDADVWLTPMPDRRLTEKEREDISATSMLAADDVSVDPNVFRDGQVNLIKRAASYRNVERVLVHPAIKQALCKAAGSDRAWLSKVRPYWGHYYHMHIRIGCPKGSNICKSQPPPPGDDGCGAEIADWLKKIAPSKTVEKPPAAKPDTPVKKKSGIMLSDLPAECRTVLAAGESKPAEPPVATAAATADGAAPKATAKPAAKKKAVARK